MTDWGSVYKDTRNNLRNLPDEGNALSCQFIRHTLLKLMQSNTTVLQ